MKIHLNEASVVGGIGIVVGVIGTIFGAYQEKKQRDIAKKLDISLDKLENHTEVEIREDVVNKATANAVERQVSAAVKKAIGEVSAQIRDDMDSMIRKDVDRVYNDLKSEVEERVSEEIADIDYDEMRKSIRRRAEEKVFDEFCGMVNFGKILGSGNARVGGNWTMDEVGKVLDRFWTDSDKQKALSTIFGHR